YRLAEKIGVDKDLALPAIAVIGDQSSGKSSVLEALSRVSLPRGSGIVTRCPLELKLKKAKEDNVWKGKLTNEYFQVDLTDPSEVEKEIQAAQNIMAGEGLGISQELISLQIESSNVPDLTLIDLPGIARVAIGNQPADIGDQIRTEDLKKQQENQAKMQLQIQFKIENVMYVQDSIYREKLIKKKSETKELVTALAKDYFEDSIHLDFQFCPTMMPPSKKWHCI
ncbi:protein Mx1-like, partial [Chiloscyllium plagiosum]|uniref:protein Mx1-like n=1 Tax=Chiloscyllium plagiosum TaxID=36176 RepID=UPI001CB838BF